MSSIERRRVLAALPVLAVPISEDGGRDGTREGAAKDCGAAPDAAPAAAGDTTFTLRPIGRVEIAAGAAAVRVFAPYADGLLGLDQWSHVLVFYWFDRNDTPGKRGILRVHPRGNRENPLTGVFACRSPFRPNLIAFSLCRIVAVEGGLVRLDGIDAFDGTPVLDLKPYTPADAVVGEVQVPGWAQRHEPGT